MSWLDKKIEFKKPQLPKLDFPKIEGFPKIKWKYVFYGALALVFVSDGIDLWDIAIIWFVYSVFDD